MKNDDVHGLATSIRTLTSVLSKRLRQEMRAIDNLSVTEVTVLSDLYTYKSLYPSEMAARVNIKAQSMSQIINRLDELKLIDKTPSASDKRKIAISLSSHGRQLVEQTRHERDRWLATIINENFSTTEVQLLQKAVTLLRQIAEHK